MSALERQRPMGILPPKLRRRDRREWRRRRRQRRARADATKTRARFRHFKAHSSVLPRADSGNSRSLCKGKCHCLLYSSPPRLDLTLLRGKSVVNQQSS